MSANTTSSLYSIIIMTMPLSRSAMTAIAGCLTAMFSSPTPTTQLRAILGNKEFGNTKDEALVELMKCMRVAIMVGRVSGERILGALQEEQCFSDKGTIQTLQLFHSQLPILDNMARAINLLVSGGVVGSSRSRPPRACNNTRNVEENSCWYNQVLLRKLLAGAEGEQYKSL